MIQKLEVSGIHVVVRSELRSYIGEKLGGLDRYIPKHARESAHIEVRMGEGKFDGRKQPVCEASLYLPRDKVLAVAEHAPTTYAAVDMVHARLKQQIKRYKDQLPSGERAQHIFARLGRRLRLGRGDDTASA